MNSKSLGPSPPPPSSPPRTTPHSWCVSLNWVFLISMGQRGRKSVRGLARGLRLLCQGTWPSSRFIELWFTEVKIAPSILLWSCCFKEIYRVAVPCCRSVSGSAVGHRQHSLSEYYHPPLTRRERKKNTLPISPFVRVVAPSAREAPICLSFHFQHFI